MDECMMGNSNSIEELLKTMRVLRSKNGCEWDKAQTHLSLKPYIIEESFEVVEAIDSGDQKKLKEELGDLLLQIVFQSIISEEEKSFDFYDVVENLNEKLIRRHPHVFSSEKGYSYERWEEIKSKEKGKPKTKLGEINPVIPALSMARRIQENAAEYGFDWKEVDPVYDKVYEEIEEVKNAKSPSQKEEEIGDLLFAVVNLSRHLGIDPESALRRSTTKFVNRFEKMNKMAENEGIELKSLEVMEEFWKKSKEGE
nr:nucleoside triphosphate pyrophosphohydrolase [Athalassotoga saccharophila]